jgi:hypothetical protein
MGFECCFGTLRAEMVRSTAAFIEVNAAVHGGSRETTAGRMGGEHAC